MRVRILMGVAALALGSACASAPALAKNKTVVQPPAQPSYSNTTASGAPLSPGGISTGGSAYGGPGYNSNATATSSNNGRTLMNYANPGAVNYSNTAASGAPLSPGGISTGGSAYGGPGYNSSPSGTNGPSSTVSYSTSGPSGAPLSPGGISAGGSSFRGPGYAGQ